MRTFFMILITIPLTVFSVSAGTIELSYPEIHKQASLSLETLKKIVSQQKNYKAMGFNTLDELNRVQLGKPYQVYIVRLDRLRKYDSENDSIKMLSGGNLVVYPILVDNAVRSSITLSKVDDSWQAVSFGRIGSLTTLSITRTQNAEKDKMLDTAYFIVQVPALNYEFIGYSLDDRLFLTPIEDDLRYDMKAGTSMQAGDIFNSLVPEARRHKGQPR